MDHKNTQAAEAAANIAAEADRKAPRFPTLTDLLVFLGIFFVAQVAGLFAAFALGMKLPDTVALASGDSALQIEAGRFNAVCYIVAMAITLVATLLYRSRRHAPKAPVRCSARGFNPTLLLWYVAIMISASIVLEPLLMLLPEIPDSYGRGGWAVLALVVAAPIFEELLFRGVLLESLRVRYGIIAAWVISSLLFGIVHLVPAVAVNAAVMGLVLGFAYVSTGSIWAPVILHFINNSISYLLLVAGYGDTTVIQMVGSETAYYAVYAGALAIFLLSGWAAIASLGRMRGEEKNHITE